MANASSRAQALWSDLVSSDAGAPFDPEEIAGLPEPARRHLLHAIAPGTPIAGSVELTMRGSMLLQPGGTERPMRARQVLASPRGSVWRATVGSGLLRMRGFDAYGEGRGWMRWHLWGIPLVRAEGEDVSRSAAGRVAGEAVLFPPALLPRSGAVWSELGGDTAVARITVDGWGHDLRLDVAPEGRLRSVTFERWRTDRGGATLHRFVMDQVDAELSTGGYTIPSRFRAGWNLGADDEFPFFRAEIIEARFR